MRTHVCAGAGTTLVLVERTHVRRASGHLCISYRVTGAGCRPCPRCVPGARGAGPPARARTSQNGLNAARRPFLFFCFRSSFKRTPRDRHASTKLKRLTTTSSAVGSRPSTALKVGIRIHARAQPVRYKKHRGQCVMGARARQPPPVRVPYHRPTCTRGLHLPAQKKVAKNEREPITGTDIPTEPALNEPIRDRTESHQSNLLLILAALPSLHAKLFSQKRNVTSLWSFTTMVPQGSCSAWSSPTHFWS